MSSHSMTLLLSLVTVLGSIHGARILGILPFPSISHQLPMQAVMKELAARGHQVTVITPSPPKTPIINYTVVDTSFMFDFWKNRVDYNKMATTSKSWMNRLYMMREYKSIWTDLCRTELDSKPIQDFIKSNQTFDLVFFQALQHQCLYGLIHVVGSPPVIGIVPLGGSEANFANMGNPNNPSYNPDNWFIAYTDRMSFSQRLANTMLSMLFKAVGAFIQVPDQEDLLREYFGPDPPSVWETDKNFSMIFLNNHYTLSYPRALLPGIIELGSLHIQNQTNKLPADLQEFLDTADQGFIYFSLGSNVRSDKMPEEKRRQFLEAFSHLPQRVLWKWESDVLPGQPKNVRLGKWLPQQDILAHPKLRVFMTQGGLQSIQEAVHHGVPLVGIPFINEQEYNMNKMTREGVGLAIDIETCDADTILKTLRAVIEEPRYRHNMKRLSTLNKDQPETPMERAIWWTEYVLRHNGAKHLRSAALDLAWWEYLLLDVIATIVFALLLATWITCWVARRLYRFVVGPGKTKKKQQ